MTNGLWKLEFSRKLSQLLQDRDMDIYDLCIETGLQEVQVRNYLECRYAPTLFNAINISKALGVSLSELCDYGEMIYAI